MDKEDKEFPTEIRSILHLKKGTLVKIVLKEGKGLGPSYANGPFEVGDMTYPCGSLKEITGRVVGDIYNPRRIIINPFGEHNYTNLTWPHSKRKITDGIYVPLALIEKYEPLRAVRK